MNKIVPVLVALCLLLFMSGPAAACEDTATVNVTVTVESWVEVHISGILTAQVNGSDGSWTQNIPLAGIVKANDFFSLTAYPVVQNLLGHWVPDGAFHPSWNPSASYAIARHQTEPAKQMLYKIKLCSPAANICSASGFSVTQEPGVPEGDIFIGLDFGSVEAPLSTDGSFADPGTYQGFVQITAAII